MIQFSLCKCWCCGGCCCRCCCRPGNSPTAGPSQRARGPALSEDLEHITAVVVDIVVVIVGMIQSLVEHQSPGAVCRSHGIVVVLDDDVVVGVAGGGPRHEGCTDPAPLWEGWGPKALGLGTVVVLEAAPATLLARLLHVKGQTDTSCSGRGSYEVQ